MHENSRILLQKALERYAPGVGALADDPPHVLDVGALDVNGTYGPLIRDLGWYYTGLDILPGPNVEIVAENPYHYPIETGAYDIVISGSTAYAVLDLVAWTNELARCVKPGGLMVVITPNFAKPPTIAKSPVDLWRMSDAALMMLFENTGVLADIEMGWAEYDVMASALRIRGEIDEPKSMPEFANIDYGEPSTDWPEPGYVELKPQGPSHPSQKPKTVTPKKTPAKTPSKVARKGK